MKKMQWFPVLTLSALCLVACKERETRYEYYEDDPKKPYRVYEVDKQTGKLDGSYKEYYEDGTLKMDGSYKDGRLDGPRKAKEPEFYDYMLIVEDFYKDGLLEGTRKKYYIKGGVNGNEKGVLRSEENFKNGHKNGPFKWFNENGVLMGEESYKDDLKDGIFREYDEKGTLRKEKNYKDGALVGSLKVYSEDGKLVSKGRDHELYFTDPRDNQSYPVVTIGEQAWMSARLNYKTSDSYCYQDLELNCDRYGRLYTWNAAKKACPEGWHLPRKVEFETMRAVLGEDDRDIFFSALPVGESVSSYTGIRNDDGYHGQREEEDQFSNFWSSTDVDGGFAYSVYVFMSCCDIGAGLDTVYKKDALSVLCVEGDDARDQSYAGYWLGDGNDIFEVLTENGREFIIRNDYGDLEARIKDGALRGKNSAGEEIFMAVKGDTAFYDNGRMLNGYKRITRDEYFDIKAKIDIDKVLEEVLSE